MALDVRRRRTGGGEKAVEIVDVVGRLDAPGGALLRTTIQEILKEGVSRIALNLSECVEIHREMMGTFHSLGRACIRAGGGLVLFGATGDILEYVKKFADSALAPHAIDERSAIIALGGQVEAEEVKDDLQKEPPIVVALGSDPIFRAVFWKLTTLGGRNIAKFDSIQACFDYIPKRPVHSLLVDASLPTHEIARCIRNVKTKSNLRNIGVFAIGAPSRRAVGRVLVEEGADYFVPFTFNGEEILSKLDARTFFKRLKELYERFDSKPKAKEIR